MMEEKRIRLFIPTGVYPPDIGGPATYVPLLEKHLPQYGFVIDVLPFRAVRFLPKGISHLVYFFMALTRSFRADVVYAQDSVSVGFPARLAAFIARKSFIVKIVGDHVWEQGRQRLGVTEGLDDFPKWPHHPYLFFLRVLQQIVVRTAEKIIVPSVYLKKIILEWKVSESKIAVVYNGIETPVEATEPRESARPLVVSVGRLVPWKGFAEVIRSIKNEAWHLVIVGDGPLRQELEKIARDEGCNDRVHFTGLLPREELHGWLKAADVFVLNSTYEGLPHTLIEAMALGTPVIASDIESNREVVTHGREGLLVSPYDSEKLRTAIEEIFSDKGETERRTAAARLRAADFSVEQTIQGLVHILRSV